MGWKHRENNERKLREERREGNGIAEHMRAPIVLLREPAIKIVRYGGRLATLWLLTVSSTARPAIGVRG